VESLRHASRPPTRLALDEFPAPAQVEYGLLGVGLVEGTTSNTQVLGNLLQQPVGIFSSVDRVLKLRPLHMPPPEQITGVDDLVLPLQTRLLGCYPNPFNPYTSIRFELKEPCEVRIGVYRLASVIYDTRGDPYKCWIAYRATAVRIGSQGRAPPSGHFSADVTTRV